MWNQFRETGKPGYAEIFSGRRVQRRWVEDVAYATHAQAILQRELSEQGKKDVGEGPVIGFKLGERFGVGPVEQLQDRLQADLANKLREIA